jgi:epoxyqueuosine reductase
MKKVLLHICCAGCASVAVMRLKEEGFSPLGIFYNPNIYPESEYNKRRQDFEKISREYDFSIIEDSYEPRAWFDSIKGYESEPEGSKRCEICFKFRLSRVYRIMQDKGYGFFTTTLTISPHKNSRLINKIGQDIAGERFLQRDFKKEDGFKKSVKISKELDLYRQNYCGCVYSKND